MSNETIDSIAHLVDRPYEFNFVQAVTLLQGHAERESNEFHFVGFDHALDQEVVRFRVSPTLRNNSSQVTDVQQIGSCYELTVPFIGLVGVNGVLPRHYTQAVIGRVKQHDYAMRDFYDLFHHRIISMFFRASVKYRLPFLYQLNSLESPDEDDSITQAIRCLVGLGDTTLKNKMAIHDHTILRYGGHFADQKPTGHSLQRVIEEFIGLPTKILQFQFEWLYIDPSEQTQLSASATHQLGVDVVIGDRVPSFQNRFRIRVGPVSWRDFVNLIPTSAQVTKLADLVRLYVGISLDFDLQVTVDGREIPKCAFNNDHPPMLGWTTWLFSEPIDSVVEDAVFDIGIF